MLILIVVLCMSIGVPLTFMALTTIDDTPPSIWNTQPIDGQVYQPDTLTYVEMWARDDESHVNGATAYYILDGGTPIKLDLQPSQPVAYPRAIAFEKSGLSEPSVGTHTFKFQVKNNNDLLGELSGTFQISGTTPPTELEGTWYINGIPLTSPNQVVRLTTKTLTFKFTKTEGIEDTGILCTVDWTGPTIGRIALLNTGPSTWSQTYTFVEGGQYSMSLQATDGTQTVTMSIFDVGLGDGWQPSKLQLMMFGGITFIGIGIVAFILLRKRS